MFCETPADVHPEPLCSPGVVRELHAELQQARAELDTYHAAAYSTDLDGDVRDHLHDLADWDDTDGSAPGWLVDAVMGLLAPHRARAEQAETAVTAHKTAIIEALQRAEQAEAEVKRIRAELDAWKARAEDAERGSIPQLREARQRAEQAEAAIKRAGTPPRRTRRRRRPALLRRRRPSGTLPDHPRDRREQPRCMRSALARFMRRATPSTTRFSGSSRTRPGTPGRVSPTSRAGGPAGSS